MTIYIVIFVLFFGASILEAGDLKKSQTKWLFWGLATILTLFVGLRYNTGADSIMYIYIYDGGANANMEFGYLWLNDIFKDLFNDYYVLQFFATLFFVFSISRFYKKEVPYPIAALTLMMSFMLFNILMAQVRQGFAIAIIVLFSHYIFERKIWHFLLGITIASFFHASAVLAIPLYFLYRNYGKILLVVLILAANVFYFYPELLKIIVLQVAPILPEIISEKATLYMDSIFAKSMKFNTGLFYLSQLIITLSLVILVDTIDRKKAFFINTLVIYAIIKAFATSVLIFGRVESYYLIFAVVAFTFFWDIKIKWIQLKTTRFIFASILLLWFYIPVIKTLNDTSLNVFNRPVNYFLNPYYNCISHPEEAKKRVEKKIQ